MKPPGHTSASNQSTEGNRKGQLLQQICVHMSEILAEVRLALKYLFFDHFQMIAEPINDRHSGAELELENLLG